MYCWGAEINPYVLDHLSNSAWRMSGEYLQGASKGEPVAFKLFLKSTLQTLKSITYKYLFQKTEVSSPVIRKQTKGKMERDNIQ